MRPRIVTVVLELETDAPLRFLRDPDVWRISRWDKDVLHVVYPHQVSVQVATPPKPRAKKKARR